MRSPFFVLGLLACGLSLGFQSTGGAAVQDSRNWVVYQPGEGPGKGKHIVLISGDEEYRSEEGLPMLGLILAAKHGFKCTVLFAVNKSSGEIDPNTSDNIPGLDALDDADLMIILTRFRNLPADQMKHIDAYLEAGKPVIGLRTATHAFNIGDDKSPSARWHWQSKVDGFEGGFGRIVLGETWISHHGNHGSQSTRGVVAKGEEANPIVRGCEDVWGPTDVYGVRLPLPGDSKPLILGQVLSGMKPTDKPVDGKQNDPLLPVAWTKTYKIGASGKTGKAFCTTMGASQDLESEGLRRLIVNAAYWALNMENQIPARADVGIVGEYHPTRFGFNGFKRGVKPADYAVPAKP